MSRISTICNPMTSSSNGKRSNSSEGRLTTAPMSKSSVNELEHCRSVLLRVLKSLSNEQLDFQIFPDSKSIGELLLHVAGFEFLIISGVRLLAGHTLEHHLWRKLKPGFSREAGFP